MKARLGEGRLCGGGGGGGHLSSEHQLILPLIRNLHDQVQRFMGELGSALISG